MRRGSGLSVWTATEYDRKKCGVCLQSNAVLFSDFKNFSKPIRTLQQLLSSGLQHAFLLFTVQRVTEQPRDSSLQRPAAREQRHGCNAEAENSREHTHRLPPAKAAMIYQQSSPPEPEQQRGKQPLQSKRQPACTLQQQQQHKHAGNGCNLETTTAECSRRGCSG